MKLRRLGGYYSYSGESWLWFKEVAMEIKAKMDLGECFGSTMENFLTTLDTKWLARKGIEDTSQNFSLCK